MRIGRLRAVSKVLDVILVGPPEQPGPVQPSEHPQFPALTFPVPPSPAGAVDPGE
jgi:hypothetical protein